ncbi:MULTISPECIES: alpha/beta fold hydrolase [unclassified Thioalkalivibrio]|uniref:alpha/beta fold hydrolase n=1 Tax=unclassified Thioalkalivibrio TaxID=2621013 RepID=UPI000361F315|nr:MULTISPECIES: alpha/beta fold hydrolase [unclassified Thioalkalivibrio]
MKRPTLVLLHGWGFSPAVWAPLRAALPGFEIHAPALPGHGELAGGEALGDPVATCEAIRAQLPRPLSRPIWLGWSLGGLVALELARQIPDTRGLVLLNSTPRFAAAPDWGHALPAAELADFQLALEGPRRRLHRRLAMLCARGSPEAASLAADLTSELEGAPATDQGLAAGLACLMECDQRVYWQSSSVPLGACLAEGDALVPSTVADDLRGLRPDARLVVRPGGHAQWWQDPAPVAAFINEFLAALE